MLKRRFAATLGGTIAVLALLQGVAPGRARAWDGGGADRRALRVEARFLDPVAGIEAPWGATGQILIPPRPADPALEHWREARAIASSASRQSLLLEPGAAGLIRVGRGIPFAGWFLRHGVRCGLLAQDTPWREVESALVIEAAPPEPDGLVRLTLTPEFSYLQGRSRVSVLFADARLQVALETGTEARLVPPASHEAFYRRLLAGYDPLRRVWPVDLLVRVDLAHPPEP